MTFNSDPNRKAQEVNFSCKIKETSHPSLICNNNSDKCIFKNTWAYIWTVNWTSVNISRDIKKSKQNNQFIM